MKRKNIQKVSLCALFSAIIAGSAFISIPTPLGVNLTMQMFAVCLAGLCLGIKGGIAAVAVYIAVGAAGIPIFSSFTGGIGVLIGPSGGFLWGFLFVAAFCGMATKQNNVFKILFCASAVLACHILGIIQYSIVTGVGIWTSAITASLPFLLKDFIIVFSAFVTAKKISNKIKR